MADYRIDRFSEENLDDYIEILSRSRADDPYERRLTRDEARLLTVDEPDFDPDGAWVLWVGDEAAGYGGVIVEKNRLDLGMNDGYIDIEVVPERRGEGFEEALLERALGRLRERGVSEARTRCLAADTWRSNLLDAFSFAERYRVYIMIRKGRTEIPHAPVPAGFDVVRRNLRDCTDKQIVELVEVLNDSFRDHLEFSREKPERFVKLRDATEDEHWIAAAMKGTEMAGFSFSDVSSAFNEERGTLSGWVGVLGVRRPYRGLGLGKALLAEGMRWVLEQGMDTIYLGVFAENEKALDLYKSFGFEKDQESKWCYRRLGRD